VRTRVFVQTKKIETRRRHSTFMFSWWREEKCFGTQLLWRWRARSKILRGWKKQAEKTVKQALKGQGLKPQHIARREIVTMAKDYLAAHPELIAEAKPIVEQWRKEGFFGKKAARQTGHILRQVLQGLP
jgi:hypothetical protein